MNKHPVLLIALIVLPISALAIRCYKCVTNPSKQDNECSFSNFNADTLLANNAVTDCEFPSWCETIRLPGVQTSRTCRSGTLPGVNGTVVVNSNTVPSAADFRDDGTWSRDGYSPINGCILVQVNSTRLALMMNTPTVPVLNGSEMVDTDTCSCRTDLCNAYTKTPDGLVHSSTTSTATATTPYKANPNQDQSPQTSQSQQVIPSNWATVVFCVIVTLLKKMSS